MRDNNLSSSNTAIQERKRHIYVQKKIILVQANADTLYALNKSLAQKEKKKWISMCWQATKILKNNDFFFLLAIIMCLSMLHEVGHFLELSVGARNVL